MPKTKGSRGYILPKFDDLFNPTDNEQQSAEKDKVVELPVAMLQEFKDHPFRVEDDDSMKELAENILSNGIITPLLVRKTEENVYEIISGHRRRYAAIKAGLEKVPAIIREYASDDEATIAMVSANRQREHLRVSEKAKSYKREYDAMCHQGKAGGRSLEKMEEGTGESQMTIHRYIRMAALSDELLELADAGNLGLSQGVDLSYLDQEAQKWVYDLIKEKGIRISMKQSTQLKESFKNGKLSMMMVSVILDKKKTPIVSAKVAIERSRIEDFFETGVSDKEIEETLVTLLRRWKEGDITL